MDIIGDGLSDQLEYVRELAKRDLPAFFIGAPGTGKELVAQVYAEEWCAERSLNPETDYGVINCSHFTAELLRSELFGYKEGAFTGAISDHKGAVERYKLLCFDELGASKADVYPQLLRLVEYHEYQPVGLATMVRWDGQIIACSNAPGGLPADLRSRFYDVTLPSLIERPADLIAVVETLAPRHKIRGFTRAFLSWAVDHDWPGNVRELLRVVGEGAISGVLDIPREQFGSVTGQYPHSLRAATGMIEIGRFRREFLEAWPRGLQYRRFRETVAIGIDEFTRAWQDQHAARAQAGTDIPLNEDECKEGLAALAKLAASRAAGTKEPSPADADQPDRAKMIDQLREAGSVSALADKLGVTRSTMRWRLGMLNISAIRELHGRRKRRTK